MKGSRQLGAAVKVPVPSDIDIAQSVVPLPIKDIAANSGILESEVCVAGREIFSEHLKFFFSCAAEVAQFWIRLAN
jgi:hypothetical protein